ncbi:hypothetical protein GPECTOR_14g232 [Gonium pectorale]|uniref:Uncharacterized protein n=1 Tax=Gonium pectorale TaxID=33097 RepID=A0A150GMI7_GONPE|nr:hypothetical protein GPECTOR_14g232 [Gonium pectorale]|eukprot:KXZ50991.1 hypothetical protein GPECTOR_14g232 [Gonium pectorale]
MLLAPSPLISTPFSTSPLPPPSYPAKAPPPLPPPQANNTVIIGLPVMEATFPNVGGRLSLLSAFPLFLQIIPYSITTFEVDKWVRGEHARDAAAAAAADAAAAAQQQPPTPRRELSGRWVDHACDYGGNGDGGGDGGGG